MRTKYGFGTAANPTSEMMEWKQEQVSEIDETISDIDIWIQDILSDLAGANGWHNSTITKTEVVWVIEEAKNKVLELTLEHLHVANTFLFDIYSPIVKEEGLEGQNVAKLHDILHKRGGLFAKPQRG